MIKSNVKKDLAEHTQKDSFRKKEKKKEKYQRYLSDYCNITASQPVYNSSRLEIS